MKTVSASIFRAQWLALIDEVESTREAILVTKRGRPMAQLVPVEIEREGIFGFLAGKGRITGDLVSSVVELDEWDVLR